MVGYLDLGGLLSFSVAQETHQKIKWVFFFFFLGLNPRPMDVPGLGGPIRATAAGLHHSHSNAKSEQHLRPIPQLMAMPDL